jgi:diguanylate cyclase (GGDEF)-like protein
MLDDETQVLRKSVFDYLFDLEVKKAIRYQYFLTVLFLELDGAEGTDGTGEDERQAQGEEVRVLADLLRDELRSTDVIGKHDDGRFSVLLHHADEVNTLRIGERLRRRIADYVFSRGQEGRKTVSIGGACFPTSGNFPEDLLSAADQMLRRAKQEGGNKVYLYT